MSARPDRRSARLPRLIALLAVLVAGVVTVIVLPGGGSHPSSGRGTSGTATGSSPTVSRSQIPPGSAGAEPSATTTVPLTPASESPATASTTATSGDAGALPQTDAFPSASGSQFQGEMSALWQGVLSGSLPPALPAFFPESAYLQVKAISDPSSDYVHRLLDEFGADLLAAHSLLGASPGPVHFLRVAVSSQYGHWVQPGTCYNRIGYFEVPNSRLVYQDSAGRVRSFGIASMISWRGVWYVVHLGAVSRSSDQGVVDSPEAGPGAPLYSSTC